MIEVHCASSNPTLQPKCLLANLTIELLELLWKCNGANPHGQGFVLAQGVYCPKCNQKVAQQTCVYSQRQTDRKTWLVYVEGDLFGKTEARMPGQLGSKQKLFFEDWSNKAWTTGQCRGWLDLSCPLDQSPRRGGMCSLFVVAGTINLPCNQWTSWYKWPPAWVDCDSAMLLLIKSQTWWRLSNHRSVEMQSQSLALQGNVGATCTWFLTARDVLAISLVKASLVLKARSSLYTWQVRKLFQTQYIYIYIYIYTYIQSGF